MTQTAPVDSNNYILIGRIAGSFGIRGQLKMVAITNDINHLRRHIRTFYLGPKHQAYKVLGVLEHKPGLIILTLDGVTSRVAADALRSMDVAIYETEVAPLADGEYFIHSLFDLLVVTDTGEELGRVKEVIETGANDVLVVARPEGEDVLIPMIQDVIRDLDITNQRVVVHLIAGLL